MTNPNTTADVAALVRLLSLPHMGPARLRWLLSVHEPAEAVAQLCRGRLPPVSFDLARPLTESVSASWFDAIASETDEQILERLHAESISVLTPNDSAWPFVDDPEPPALLFCRGNVELLASRPSVAIVGTRRCTSLGRRVAFSMGEELARAGVHVVSGLALGIDGAAHQGALGLGVEGGEQRAGAVGAVVGVVATGLDVVYPKRHRQLWDDVSQQGVLVSESPPGTVPARWRFPARNRIIASLADLVVVVESHIHGGALSTVDEAIERGVPVLTVPGSVLSPASEGANALLFEGAFPVRHAGDVLELLGLSSQQLVADFPSATDQGGGAFAETPPPESSVGQPAATVLAELAAGSQTIDELATRAGGSVGDTLALVQRLALDDLVVIEGGRVRLS